MLLTVILPVALNVPLILLLPTVSVIKPHLTALEEPGTARRNTFVPQLTINVENGLLLMENVHHASAQLKKQSMEFVLKPSQLVLTNSILMPPETVLMLILSVNSSKRLEENAQNAFGLMNSVLNKTNVSKLFVKLDMFPTIMENAPESVTFVRLSMLMEFV